MTDIYIREFKGDNLDLVDGLCLHPDDPEEMLSRGSPPGGIARIVKRHLGDQ